MHPQLASDIWEIIRTRIAKEKIPNARELVDKNNKVMEIARNK
jgi:hypothetical protein